MGALSARCSLYSELSTINGKFIKSWAMKAGKGLSRRSVRTWKHRRTSLYHEMSAGLSTSSDVWEVDKS